MSLLGPSLSIQKGWTSRTDRHGSVCSAVNNASTSRSSRLLVCVCVCVCVCLSVFVCVCVGFTLVITPLVSLMEDQLMFLNGVDVPAVCLNASSSRVTNRSGPLLRPSS